MSATLLDRQLAPSHKQADIFRYGLDANMKKLLQNVAALAAFTLCFQVV